MDRISQLIEVKVDGSLDDELLSKLQRHIREALELRPRVLCVDLARCPVVDAHCWPLLRAAEVEAGQQGTRLLVRDKVDRGGTDRSRQCHLPVGCLAW